MIDKNILIIIETGYVARSLLRSNFLFNIKSDFSKVILVVPREKVNSYKKLYGFNNVIIESIIDSYPSIFQKKFNIILKYSIHAKVAKLKIMRKIFKESGFRFNIWILYFPLIFFSYFLSRFKLWRKILRFIYSFFPVNIDCINLLKKYNIDIIYANYTSIGVRDFNLNILKAAKSLGIKTVGNIFSWDNLFSKVFITTHTDFITVPNQQVAEDAVNIGDFKRDSVKIVGLPHFDFYFNHKLILPKDDFFDKIGANPKKDFFIFAFGAGNQRVDYEYFLDLLNKISEKCGGIQFYLRPYPKNYYNKSILNKYFGNKNLIFEKRPLDNLENLGNNFEFPEEDNQLLFNLLYHSRGLICLTSTLMIEACLMNTPIINLLYLGDKKINYYYRPERHYELDHIVRIFKRNFSIKVRNDNELVNAINSYLMNKELHQKERKETALEQMHIVNGTSARELAAVLSSVGREI